MSRSVSQIRYDIQGLRRELEEAREEAINTLAQEGARRILAQMELTPHGLELYLKDFARQVRDLVKES